MAHMNQHQYPNFYNTEQEEIKVEIEDEQETALAEERRSVGESALGFFVEEPRYQGILYQQGDINLVICISIYITNPSQGSYQSPGELQLEGEETSVASIPQPAEVPVGAQIPGCAQVLEWAKIPPSAGVPHPRRNTRPRVRRGVTPWQLSELEGVFEDNQYPGEITKKDLARRLYMKVSEVHCWFKKRRAKYRKNQRLQMVKGASDGTQKISH
ncbi:Homeobox protein ESX1 [Microtus ochrogaster]|uniref:Homeobox protein ESX1 n=1 Tax=Microtus ochrogaster TaxID=79684 RepID=A0A8J6GS75_MICOH|nr:Homeobox protein ESX1 [Microtus ochrogaster]